MALVSGQDSNLTSIRYAFEQTQGVLPVTPDWILTEPNEEPEFGGDVEAMARDPISDDRQSLKGSVVDIKADVAIQQDFTLVSQRALLTAYMFANERGLLAAATLTTVSGGNTINGTGMGSFVADDLVFLANAGENTGLHLVTSATSTTVVVASALANGAIPAGATLEKVGIQCASADIDVSTTGNFSTYTSTTTNFTMRLSLTPGQSIYVGGDLAAEQFTNAANNGFKRVFSVAAAALVVDKSNLDMVAETGTGKTIRIFSTCCLRNEQGSSYVQKFLQFERSLGATDDAQPTQIQSEYVIGAMASEFAFDAKPASKITASNKFMGLRPEARTGAVGVKSGNRPALPQVDAFNTASDPRRVRVSLVSTSDEAPDPLWALTESITLNVNNNIKRNLALGTVGAARFSVGKFEVSGSFNAYFRDVAALTAAQNNADVTADFAISGKNVGFAFDLPLITITKARAQVSQDEPIMLPCDYRAHSGQKVNANFDHTLMWTWFSYLPTLAQTVA